MKRVKGFSIKHHFQWAYYDNLSVCHVFIKLFLGCGFGHRFNEAVGNGDYYSERIKEYIP
jgi:hypothetical protein